MRRFKYLLVSFLFIASAFSFTGCEEILNDDPAKEKSGGNISPTKNDFFVRSVIDLHIALFQMEYLNMDPSDPAFEAVQSLLQLAQDFSDQYDIYFGLSDVPTLQPKFTMDFNEEIPEVPPLLSTPAYDAQILNPTMLFYLTSILIVEKNADLNNNEGGNIYRIYPDSDPFEFYTKVQDMKGKTGPTGGCCAILAAAHSLVRKMGGLVNKDDVTTGEKGSEVWDPDFLKKVWDESDDDDHPNGNRGLSDGEGEAAHEGNYNDDWKAEQVDDDYELFDDDKVDCNDLKARYEYMSGRLETNDDLTMRIRGKDGKKGDEWGHRVFVESVTWTDGPPCCMEITVIKTSVQDGAANDFSGIPFNPGTATYKICTDSKGNTTVTNTEFPNSTITKLSFDSFDEEPR